MNDGPLARYRAHRDSGEIKPDPVQELAAEKLESLHHALAGYRPEGRQGWRERLGLGRNRNRDAPPQGLYIFGDVGRGKSMLMDLFFAAAPIAKKRRVHFHAFMLEVHGRIHEWRQARPIGDDPVPPLAQAIAAETTLLCFDEFQVEDVATAMILRRLFTTLLDAGVVVVATSNVAPSDLYKDGLQRESFLPFIDLLQERLDILEMSGSVDYRLARLKGLSVYHTPLGPRADAALDDAFRRLTDDAAGAPLTLEVQGRRLVVPRAARGVARFTFSELCERPLGAADFIALATHFHTLILAGIPELSPARRDEAKRFLILIDALYEHSTKLVCSAAAPPDRLYPAGDGAKAFLRTASRLMEMQAADYLEKAHIS
ncbi:MAG: cell division protein ZapE [Alphaproteobacteria bacterium]